MNNENMCFLACETAAIVELLVDWRASWPRMGVFALVPEAEKERLPILQGACRDYDVPLVGGIFPALVTNNGFNTEGMWLLRIDEMVPSFLFENVNAGDVDAVSLIVQAVEQALANSFKSDCQPTLYLLFDGLLPNIATILDGIYLSVADHVRYAGVNVGSETFQPMPCLFDAERVVGDGVLGLLLPGDAVTVLEHGYTPLQRNLTATATEGNRIQSIDWRPAFEVYREIINAEYGIKLTPENFYQNAVHFPFGILRANEEVVVRIPVALSDDGSLFCIGEIPENAILVLLRAPGENEGKCIEQLTRELISVNGSLQGQQLLAFYCAGRRVHLGNAAVDELNELVAKTKVARVSGALCLGEVGSTGAWSYPLFHNATLVCTPWRGA